MHTNSVHTLLQSARHLLTEANIESAATDARILLSYITGMRTEDLILNPQIVLKDEQAHQYEDVVKRRAAHEPVAKITEQKEFYGRIFMTTRDTLDPRPDSETLIEAALAILPADKPLRILDLGTGTGCLLLTLLAELPLSVGVGIDISDAALTVANINTESLNLEKRTLFICGNMFDSVSGTFDCIISNPPYIGENEKPDLSADVLQFEPHSALFAPNNGLYFYQHIVSRAAEFLVDGGLLMFEVGYRQADEVALMMKKNNFEHIEKKKDLSGTYRVVSGYKSHTSEKKCTK